MAKESFLMFKSPVKLFLVKNIGKSTNTFFNIFIYLIIYANKNTPWITRGCAKGSKLYYQNLKLRPNEITVSRSSYFNSFTAANPMPASRLSAEFTSYFATGPTTTAFCPSEYT